MNWCQYGGNLTAEFFKAANRRERDQSSTFFSLFYILVTFRQLNERYIRIMESTEEFPVMQVASDGGNCVIVGDIDVIFIHLIL